MSKAPSLGKAKCQNCLPSLLHLTARKLVKYLRKKYMFKKKTKHTKQFEKYCKMSRTQHTFTHTKSSFSPSWPKPGGSALFTGNGKMVAVATQPDNLLASLELADIWSAFGPQRWPEAHLTLRPLPSWWNRYQTGFTRVPVSSPCSLYSFFF